MNSFKSSYLNTRKIYPVTWMKTPSPGNLGDVLTPYILNNIGIKNYHVPANKQGKLICIGSISRYIHRRDVVWGTGIMYKNDPIEKSANYLAVRGPLTGDKVGCNVYGDPALLVSRSISVINPPESDIGVIPHYIDYGKVYTKGIPEINILRNNPLDVVREMLKFKSLISTSLHGIIVAHSFGIPCGWWKPTDSLDGDGSKFQDYAESVKIKLQPVSTISNVKMTLPDKNLLNSLCDKLINVLHTNHKQVLNSFYACFCCCFFF
jgi:pyruvyltransferase